MLANMDGRPPRTTDAMRSTHKQFCEMEKKMSTNKKGVGKGFAEDDVSVAHTYI